MGSSSSICEVPGKCSYNFQSQRAQTSGGNLVAHEGTSPPEEAQSEQIQPSVIRAKTAEGGEDTGFTNLKNSVSQSQCEVNVNAFSSLGFDSEVETSTNVGESKDVSNTLDIASLLPSKDTDFTRQELRVSYEDFKPGHATRVENTVEKYKQTAGHVKTAENDHLNVLNQESDEEIQAVVVKCWRDIERTCESQHNLTCSQSIDSKRGWRVVRLFVSSTFADYHAEREILVKKVVPELREWCEDRSIHLIECDLRWGVPKDSTTEATIRTCLGEVDRCLEETDGQSFFLNMLGERYGWIPSPSEISQEIQEEYKWIFPTSITHMEITHAAYRTQSQNAAFLIRNDEFIKDLPPEMLMGFVDSHPLNKAHLKALKEKLRQRFPGQVFEYDCQYDGIDESSGRPKVKLKGLENFSEFVVEFFKSAINRSVPEVKENFSAEEMEILIHDHFIEQRGRLVLGRSTEISTLMEYLQHGNPNAEDTKTENIPPLMVLASPGSGKSALMAHCTLEIKKLGWPLFYHFVGAGPGSTIPHKLVQRLVQWLKGFRADVQPENLAAVEEMSMETLEKEINQGLEEIAKREEVFVIVIDAINQLADAEATSHMDWLPSVFPHNVRCLLSAVSDSRSVFLLSEQYRTPPPVPLHIGELNESARREIVKHTLGNYNKRLDAEQMSLMIGSSGACNPLWLSLACEELRVFGVFETITHHIKSFPATIKELLQLIINRLTNEDEHNNLPKVLGLLACSKGGLSETELQFLLSDDLAEPVPMMLWAKVRRTLKPFLRNVGGRGEERLEFFHASIHEVVLETILSDYEEKMKFHSKLADFFLEHCKDEDRVILMAPEQLKLAGDKKRLLEFLRKDPRSKNRPGFWKNSYYKYLRCNKAVHVGSPFAHEIYICQFCATKRGVFGDTVQMSKDSCFICGRFTPWKDDRYVAMVCNAHRPPGGPPNMKMCFVCQRPHQNNVKAHLCPFCSTGGFKHCTMLVEE